MKDFIKSKSDKKDILLKDLEYSFIIDFEIYLKTEKRQRQVTINKALQRLKKVVKSAVINKYLDSFPFEEHKAKRVVTNVVYLTTEELEKFENHNFSKSRLEQIKDMFIFCCYTGLAYNEMFNLEQKHIVPGFDGNKWIQMIREKTNKLVSVPLLPKSTTIIEKYIHEDSLYILPRISNQKFNSYLKEISEIVGIQKNLTHHIARKTFATTVLLYIKYDGKTLCAINIVNSQPFLSIALLDDKVFLNKNVLDKITNPIHTSNPNFPNYGSRKN